MRIYKKLGDAVRQYLDKEQCKEVYAAFKFGERAHKGQKRSSGEPYITHPVAVAAILADMRLDKPTIIAAILHDVIEDTPVSKAEVAELFGDEVAELVDGVTKLTQIKFEDKAQAQAENFRKMILAMVRDIRVIIIKLADRLHNMRTLGALAPHKKRRIAKETFEIHAPIANRLGMHNLCIELQELGFEAIHPDRYQVLSRSLKGARGNRREVVKEVTNSLKKKFRELKLDIISIEGREKHIYSIYLKMKNKHLSFSEIMDVYAFRVIVDDVDMCYRVLGVVHNLYKPVPQRFKDYVAIPKVNGYQTLHTSLLGPAGLPIEIQIRTEDMHHVAENGIAAHWRYKSDEGGTVIDDAQVRAREWLKGLLDIQQNVHNPLEFIESVKVDLFPDEVYVFTPKGQIFELPRGSTPVDFAYLVHSDIGNACVAAKVNRRLVPLSTQLSNGQSIEIITAPGARPNPTWLNFVVTGKARSKIRHYLNQQHRDDSVNLGTHLLTNALEDIKISAEILTQDSIDLTLKESNYDTYEDLLEDIGLGNRPATFVAQRLRTHLSDKTIIKAQEAHHASSPLLIKGGEGMVLHFAKCCRPIPGDTITGLMTSGEGLEVHMDSCSRIMRLKHKPEKLIPVRWEDNTSEDFLVDLLIEVANKRGMLANLTKAIADANANIEHIDSSYQDTKFNELYITVSVKNRKHLAQVMRQIRLLKAVGNLQRKSMAS